jgi:hypothetical protein
LVGVDKAQAAVLNYTFRIENGGGDGFFKVDNSSLTGIGVEYVTVSEGRFNGLDVGPFRISDNYNYNNLTERAGAVFYQGAFRGLYTGDSINGFSYVDYYPGEFPEYPNGGSWVHRGSAFWEITTRQSDDPSMWTSRIWGYREGREEITGRIPGYPFWTEIYEYRQELDDAEVYYTLVDTEPEPVPEPSPVPEPLTAGGTALALAGLSLLKHKKKTAA